MYYALEYDKDLGVPAVLTESEPGHDLKYLQGLKLEPDEIPVDLKLETDTPRDGYPDLFNALRAPAATERFIKALSGAGVDNIEWFATSIHAPNGVTPGYCVLNVIGRISCLDEQKSVVTHFRGRVARIKSLEIDENRAAGAPMFRLHEYPLLILVSEGVRQRLQGLTGFTLVPAKGWTDKHRF